MQKDETRRSSVDPLRGWLRVASRALVMTLALAGRGSAWDGSPDGSEPTFKALMIDGRTTSGRIVSFEQASVTIATKDGEREALPFDRLVKLTRDSPSIAAPVESSQAVLLADGDRLMRTSIDSATDASLEIRSELLGKMAIPLAPVLGLTLSAAGPSGSFELNRDRILFESRSSEVLWLTNGDRLDGSFLGMDDRKIKLEIDHKAVGIDRAGVVALGFDAGLVKYPRPKGAFLEATLSDGTRLGLSSLKLVEGNVQAKTRFEKTIGFPVAELTRLHARTPSVIYLSERAHAGVEYASYVGPTRGYRIDRSVDGHPIQLGGQAYDRGIGTQSRTLLAYRIEPGDRRFQAEIGVDERAGPLGSVVFRVLIDGRERFRSPPMTDRDAPLALDIDLAGGKILILATEFGERGNVRDLADWAEARIVR
jgi:hypothetical protein